MATLVAENLTYSYTKKSKPALNKVSVEIKPGTLTALVGPNGAGKSTLLKILQGQNAPDKGEIKTDNNPAKDEAPTINVRDQPKSSLIGYTKTAIVKVAAAFLTNIVEPDPATIIHP